MNPQLKKLLLLWVKYQKQKFRMMLWVWIQICPSMHMSELYLSNLLIPFSLHFLLHRYCKNTENMSTSSNCDSQSQSKKAQNRKRKNSNLNEQDDTLASCIRKRKDQCSMSNYLPLDDITNLTPPLRQSKRKRRNWLKYSQWTIEN